MSDLISEVKETIVIKQQLFQYDKELHLLIGMVDRLETAERQREEAVKALEAMAESDDEWYVGRKTMQYYAICTLKRIKGENG